VEPLTRGLLPPDLHSIYPPSSTEFVDPPPKKKTFLGTPLENTIKKFSQGYYFPVTSWTGHFIQVSTHLLRGMMNSQLTDLQKWKHFKHNFPTILFLGKVCWLTPFYRWVKLQKSMKVSHQYHPHLLLCNVQSVQFYRSLDVISNTVRVPKCSQISQQKRCGFEPRTHKILKEIVSSIASNKLQPSKTTIT
jgi:hypothetical protein